MEVAFNSNLCPFPKDSVTTPLTFIAAPVITKYVFKTIDSSAKEFENGISWVGYCFAFYSLFAAFFAFYLPVIYKKTGKCRLHSIILFIGSIGLMLLYFVADKWMLFFPFLLIGIAWSGISNIPYRIIAEVAPEDSDFYFSIFSFSVVIPQVFAAGILGLITKYIFKGETNYTILFGGISMLIGSIFMYFVEEIKKPSSTKV
jgi:maltose/moltooligosaccharide transporter